MAAQHRGAGELQLAGLQHDGFVQRLMLKFVVLAEENSEQDGVPGYLHASAPFYFIALIRLASTTPTHTAIRQSATERPILAPARNHSPSFTRFKVCRLKDENVV